MTCREVSILLSQAQDQPLSAAEHARLQAHLKLCEGCENFRKQLDFLRRALRRHPDLGNPDEDR